MSARLPSSRTGRRSDQRGFVLVTGLLFIVVLTLLGLAMFRGSGLMDRISANTRDKQRALEAAESALQYGEWWLGNGGGGVGKPCSGIVDAAIVANIHTCSNALPAAYATAPIPFQNSYSYEPPGLQVVAGGGGMSTVPGSQDVRYANLPGFYIEYLGLNSDGSKQYYQVTAYGSGGLAATAAVVRSTYSVTAAVHPLDGL